MTKFKWKHPDERYTCFSEDGDIFMEHTGKNLTVAGLPTSAL